MGGQLQESLVRLQAQPWIASDDPRSSSTRRLRHPFALDAGDNHRRLGRPLWEQRRTASAVDCANVLADIVKNGITKAELEKAKGQVSGGMVLGLEDTGSRMSRNARSELNFGYITSVSEVLDRVSAVTLEDVHSLAHHLWSQEPMTAVVGPESKAAN